MPSFPFWWNRRRLLSQYFSLAAGKQAPYGLRSNVNPIRCKAPSEFNSLSGSSKRKRDAQGVSLGGCHLLVDFGPRSPSQMTDGSLPSRFINSKIFKVFRFIYALRQFSEPDSVQSTERVQLPVRFVKKEKRALSCPLFLFGGTDGS